ncbi:MAG: RNase adaptor protein RapZ [Candidatus Aminicenantes bacterium RBG_16_63_16]|nr:MAG: RNase adaptor protein RapZ [Candidatus Aminicenantes bacterium RBG_16_63_16]
MDREGDRFLIITGISGSGKTAVSHFLEDLGYYCVDNLPAKLIPSFVDLWLRRQVEIQRVALVMDIREPGFLTDLPAALEQIKKKVTPHLIFLDASDETLLKRFSESRRPHPVTRRRSVIEAIRLERRRLAPIKNMADEVFDTSSTNIAQLKELLTRRLVKGRKPTLQIVAVSFGYKYGVPLDADLIFDTRFLPNPFYVDVLRNRTGKSRQVREYVLHPPETREFLSRLYGFLDYLLPKFIAEGKSYLTIAIGCTGGRHRSVVLAEELRDYLRKARYDIKVFHRDMIK